jgi:hypothetical protein
VYFVVFSECALFWHENQSDFDSAIPWFESRRSSQLVELARSVSVDWLDG